MKCRITEAMGQPTPRSSVSTSTRNCSLGVESKEDVIDYVNVEGAVAGVNGGQVGAPAAPDYDFAAVGTDVVAVAPGVGGDESVGIGRLGQQVMNGLA